MNQEVNHWLERAKSNLEFASDVRKDNFKPNGGYIFIEEVCYELQQSVEKSLKAFLIHHRIKIPYTHNISDLLLKLKENNIAIPDEVVISKKLTDYAVETRYPHYDEPLQMEDYEEALEIAQKVYEWVKMKIKNT